MFYVAQSAGTGFHWSLEMVKVSAHQATVVIV